MGLTALAGYVFLYFPRVSGASTLVRGSSLPPFVFAWMPIVLLGAVAARVYSSIPAASESSAAS